MRGASSLARRGPQARSDSVEGRDRYCKIQNGNGESVTDLYRHANERDRRLACPSPQRKLLASAGGAGVGGASCATHYKKAVAEGGA